MKSNQELAAEIAALEAKNATLRRDKALMDKLAAHATSKKKRAAVYFFNQPIPNPTNDFREAVENWIPKLLEKKPIARVGTTYGFETKSGGIRMQIFKVAPDDYTLTIILDAIHIGFSLSMEGAIRFYNAVDHTLGISFNNDPEFANAIRKVMQEIKNKDNNENPNN